MSRTKRQRNPKSRPAPNTALRALTSSALALPGVAGSAAADSPITQTTGDYNYSFYSEDSLPESVVREGSNERYEIHVHQIHFEAPLGDTSDIQTDVVVEAMSGASPWVVIPKRGDADKAELVMSGATIEDTRLDMKVNGNFYRENGKNNLAGGFSRENDYLSVSVGGGMERHLHDKHTTVTAGLSGSMDEIDPVDDDIFSLRITGKEYKHQLSGSAGVARVINRNSVVQSSLVYQHQRGFLSDPYKRVLVGNTLQADSRPGGRHQVSWLTRFRRHSTRFNGTLHADYRFYWDNWDISSHTFDVAWYQDLFDILEFIPSFRYYSQSEASFYKPFFETAPRISHYSSDYRLSNYGALAMRARLQGGYTWDKVAVDGFVAFERYMSDENYALTTGNPIKNPALVDFNLISVGLKGRF